MVYGELEERLELVESSLAPVSPHLEERLELLESMLSRDQEEELVRLDKFTLIQGLSSILSRNN